MTFLIQDWNELNNNINVQWNHLLLGNGASIALDRRFNYSSLYDVANEKELLVITSRLFDSLNTVDFEQVLLACWHAHIVNKSLGLPVNPISNAYNEIKEALIASVQQVHCLPEDIQFDIEKIGKFACQFENVLSFNYDLTFYWAMMDFNSKNGNWFKDGFVQGSFNPQWQTMRIPWGAMKTTMVFFPHGNLMLAQNLYGNEVKLSAKNMSQYDNTPLLDTIIDYWRTEQYIPLFVSEGTASQKMQSIRRSPYLTTVYNEVLSKLGGNVVVYGFSFSQNDMHILNALSNVPPNIIAVSVFNGLSVNDQQAFCYYVSSLFARYLPYTKVFFYNSASSGCWNN